MRRLWDFPEELQTRLIALDLSKHGELIGEMSSPHSRIFTFDQGERTSPRYIVAKGLQVRASMSVDEKQKYFLRALREINNAHAVCHHPSIQRFFDVEIIYGVPFLLSRKRDATLRDVIAERPLGETEAVSVAVQIVHALSYCANKQLLCHQDLKPENIFIDFIADHFLARPDYPLRCRTFVADFELANAYLALRHPYGSRPYMAPEQYRRMDDETITPDFSRVDVFALGVILFEMLTGGVHPIGENTSLIWPVPAQEKSRKWLREDPWRRWLELGAQLDPTHAVGLNSDIKRILQDCLKPNAAERISKDELEARLNEHLKRVDQQAFKALSIMIAEFDQIARAGEENGWPYYAERVERLNSAFSERTEL